MRQWLDKLFSLSLFCGKYSAVVPRRRKDTVSLFFLFPGRDANKKMGSEFPVLFMWGRGDVPRSHLHFSFLFLFLFWGRKRGGTRKWNMKSLPSFLFSFHPTTTTHVLTCNFVHPPSRNAFSAPPPPFPPSTKQALKMFSMHIMLKAGSCIAKCRHIAGVFFFSGAICDSFFLAFSVIGSVSPLPPGGVINRRGEKTEEKKHFYRRSFVVAN